MIEMLAVDMDGTCLDARSRLTDRTLDALARADRAGILLVPTTGRAICCLPHRLRQHSELYRYVVSSNGALVTDCREETPVCETLIDRTDALSLLRELEGAGLGVAAHVDREHLFQGRLLSWMGRLVYGRDAREARRVSDMLQALARSGRDVEELQLFFLASKARSAVEQVMDRYPQLSAAYSDRYVEIFSRETSKGAALRALARHLGIPREHIACIGDGENDRSMFEAAGMRFAMGNSVPELKAAADVVLPSNREDGVAEAITRYLLA